MTRAKAKVEFFNSRPVRPSTAKPPIPRVFAGSNLDDEMRIVLRAVGRAATEQRLIHRGAHVTGLN